MKSPRTYIHPDRQTDRRNFFFGLFCLLRHKNHEYLSKGENFYAIKILSLFTYSVCDETVKMTLGQVVPNFTGQIFGSKILRIFR